MIALGRIGPWGCVRQRRPWGPAAVFVLALAGVGLAACRLPGDDTGITSDGISMDNRTTIPLRFEVVLEGRLLHLGAISAHESGLMILEWQIKAGRCTTEPVIAYSYKNDREVARHEEPLCVGDAWVIENADLDPSAVPPESVPEAVPS